MARKSVVSEAKEIQLAIELVRLGARLQLLEAETSLSRERLLKLYKELKGISPPKGMLPFSADWFITWRPNIHASLFANIHRYLLQHSDVSRIEAVVKAYQLYLEQMRYGRDGEPVLSLTRAWTLVRFLDNRILTTKCCVRCGGCFVVHSLDLNEGYTCGLCHMPSRAGKTKKAREMRASSVPQGITI